MNTGIHKSYAFISYEDDSFEEKIRKVGLKHIIDEQEVVCSFDTPDEHNVDKNSRSDVDVNQTDAKSFIEGTRVQQTEVSERRKAEVKRLKKFSDLQRNLSSPAQSTKTEAGNNLSMPLVTKLTDELSKKDRTPLTATDSASFGYTVIDQTGSKSGVRSSFSGRQLSGIAARSSVRFKGKKGETQKESMMRRSKSQPQSSEER